MGRGGRGSGGRGYSAPRTRSSAPPPAPQAPATSGTGAVASFAEGWWFSGGWAVMNRAVDAVFGPRKFEVVHTAAAADPAAAASSTCEIHAQAFQDCINHNASDISRCQFYLDLLNGCRRRQSQVAVVEASG